MAGLPPASTLRAMQEEEVQQRFQVAIATSTPLHEVLSLFWTNFFSVSGTRGITASLVGSFERDAIRAHMFGRFADLLIVASLHPAMLIYLDNDISAGTNSAKGRGRKRGVNENLGRETLELRTLGADGPYTQADVTALSNVLSGWSVIYPPAVSPQQAGAYFNVDLHEPGDKIIIGKRYADAGPDQAATVLRDLAAHPATSRNVARKIARHFVGDKAPSSLITRLQESFDTTGGDLRTLIRTLITSPEAWATPMVKLRQPIDFMMSACRVIGRVPEAKRLIPLLKAMGQPFQLPPSPKGWDDGDSAWATPDGIKTRLDWATEFSFANGAIGDWRQLARQGFGASLSEFTRQTVERASSTQQGLALLIMSPEMQRR